MIHHQSTIIYCLLVLWGLTEWFIKSRTKKNVSNSSQDKGTRYVIIASVVLSIAMLNNPFNINILLPEWGIYLGILLMILGIIFRVYAINYLGKAFTLTVQATDNQKLISSGPYSIVRNPAYTGTIISILGLAFITSAGYIKIIVKRLNIAFSHLFGKISSSLLFLYTANFRG